jgi:hypothetical protein
MSIADFANALREFREELQEENDRAERAEAQRCATQGLKKCGGEYHDIKNNENAPKRL